MKRPTIGDALELSLLEQPLLCIVHLASQHPAVQHQVVLRPDKVSAHGLIRLGETIGDEAHGWLLPEHIQVLDILGAAEIEEGKAVTVTPLPSAEIKNNQRESNARG